VSAGIGAAAKGATEFAKTAMGVMVAFSLAISISQLSQTVATICVMKGVCNAQMGFILSVGLSVGLSMGAAAAS